MADATTLTEAGYVGEHDHLGLVPLLIQLEKSRVNFGASKKSRIRAEKYPSMVSGAQRDRATQISWTTLLI